MKARYLPLFLLFFSCSALKTNPGQDSVFSSFSRIESAKLAELNLENSSSYFGPPHKKLQSTPNQELWIYYDLKNNESVQRASLVFDKKTGLLLTLTWLPPASHPLSNKDAVLLHFNNASFKEETVGWTTDHSYSNEVTYTDKTRGISIQINPGSDNVSAISFESPVPGSIASSKN